MQVSEHIGTRLRDARLALGLTQTQAADGIISASFLSLIESGQRSPSPQVVDALAARLRIHLESDPAADARSAACVAIEVALRLGEWQSALPHLAELTVGSPDREFYEALIAEQQGDLLRALRLLDDVAVRAPGTPLRLRAQVALCRASRDAGDLHRSIEIGERALATISGDPSIDANVEAELRSTLAGTYCETGDLLRARELSRPSRRVAEDAWSRAAQGWSRAMVLQSTGSFAEARALAFEALHELSTLDRPRTQAQLQNTAAWIAMQTGEYDVREIDTMLRTAEGTLRATHSPNDLALVLSSRAELAIRRGLVDEAITCISEAQMLAEGERSGHLARIIAASAQIHTAAGNTAESMRLLLQARALLEESGANRSAAGTWRQMAQTYEELGAMDLAVACLKAATDLLGLQPMLQGTAHAEADVLAQPPA